MVRNVHRESFDSQRPVAVEITSVPSPGYRETAEFLRDALAKIAELQLNPVTGLKDRRAFFRETLLLLKRAQDPRANKATEKFALAIIDIDGLKVTNDSLGHAKGDELLIVVAQSLVQQSRPTDRVYHLQGDEFALVMPNFVITPNRTEDAILFEKTINLERGISADIAAGDFPAGENMGASVGITLLGSTDDLDSLMARADERMYIQKSFRQLEHFESQIEQ